jgi:hypothetical protein
MCSNGDLTGRWLGHYLQHNHQRPITADFVQAGERLTGAMHDGHQDMEFSLFEAALESGLPPGADEQMDANLRSQFPEKAAGPIRVVSHVPAASVLQGTRKADIVYFLKTYQGMSYSGFKSGNQMLGVQRDGHSVHYEGRLSSDGLTIDGRWWIDADPARGTGYAHGLFLLRRYEAPALKPARKPWWKFW